MDTQPARDQRRILGIFLKLVAIHSLLVGIGLMVLPAEWQRFFGFDASTEPFFRVQAGVFHIVMAVAYLLASRLGKHTHGLVVLTICAKLIATVFLLTYYVVVSRIWIVLISAAGDAVMALIIWRLYARTGGRFGRDLLGNE
jgi:hypothetical protein